MKLGARDLGRRTTRWLAGIACSICLVACQPNMENDIQLQCRYMAYACGDCYPQYQVEKVFEGRAAQQELLGKDIYLEFEDEQKQREFEGLEANCAFCFLYKLRGDLRHSFAKGYILKVKEYHLEETPGCCDTIQNN